MSAKSLSRLLVEVEERFIVPVQRSPHAKWWAAAHAAAALPLTLIGKQRRYTATADGHPLSVVCVGRRKRFEPLFSRVFDRFDENEHTSHRPLLSPARLQGIRADVVAVEVHRWIAPSFRRAGWLIVPELVHWQGDLATVPPSSRSHSLRSDLRKIRKYGYTVEEADGADDWREFFEGMVLPSARERFGDGAWIPSAALQRDIAAAGTVLFVRRDGQRVAGGCVVPNGDRLWLPLIGVRGGDLRWIQEGASFAACHFSVEWARSSGFRQLDWGRTAPFVNDGVQHFNRKWGFHPAPDPITHLIAVRVADRCEAVRQAFAREPVLIHDSGGSVQAYAG
jgi:hypothetical protein